MSFPGELAGRTLAGRYEVLDLIGSGGMGEVYRARDRELDDLLALKVVRHDLLDYPEVLERFRKEVKLARRVTHPNVARAFDLVIADGTTFYTMELVEGVSLSRRLAGRPLELGEAAAIAVALCDALSAAHEAGIVHRDVKPANVLLGDDGRIVLTDFGVAAVNRELGELEGTPQFMAPEQALGEAATPAADVYALGVVLHEMLTGSTGFSGTVAEILEAKQRVEHLILDSVDPRLAQLVASATHRDPLQRPRSTRAFRRAIAPFVRETRELDTESSLRRAPPLPTVLVRPPTATTRPYLAEAFHQALLDRLVQWPRLRVVPHAVGDRGETVLVDFLVRDDEVELVATARPTSIVARFPLDVTRLGRSVEQTARLVAVLAGSDASPPPLRARPVAPEALDLILQARYDARRDRSALPLSIARCEQARALAPTDARVLAALAACQAQFAFYEAGNPETLLDAANRNALAALATDSSCASAHLARGHVELNSGRPEIAARCFRAAITRAPMMSEAHEWLGRMLLEAGFVVDAMARLDNTFAVGPLPVLRWGVALARALEGRWDEVDREMAALRGLGVDGGRGYVLRLSAWRGDRGAQVAAHAELARFEGAMTFERDLVLTIYDPVRPWSLRRDEILAVVEDRELGDPRRRAFIAQLAAEAAMRGGDVETCLTMLLRANSAGLFHLHWLDRCPLLQRVRDEPRYAVIRADVARRAEAIHDALYSDELDQATMVTAAAPGSR